MNLVLFDVDGTLLDNSRGDDKCYERAFEREFGVTEIDQDWSRYPHSTDSCITRTILRDHLGREATDDELRRSREAYCRELRADFAANASASVPMRGVGEAIARASLGGWAMALATGGWRVSALLKLEHARLPCASMPGAFADDHISREGIVSIARERAEAVAGRAAERVVYVGDGVWDVRASAVLGIPFVGIAHGRRADQLRAAGAEHVLADFADAAAFLDALDRAAPPG